MLDYVKDLDHQPDIPAPTVGAILTWLWERASPPVRMLIAILVAVVVLAVGVNKLLGNPIGQHFASVPTGSTTTLSVPTTIGGPRVTIDPHPSRTFPPVAATTTTTKPPSPTFDDLCRSAAGGVIQPGDGAPTKPKEALKQLITSYGAVIAGCVTAAQLEPGTNIWYQEGFQGIQVMSVSTWSPSYGAAIALGDPATEADALLHQTDDLLHQNISVALSPRQYKESGDAQVLWTSIGSYLFVRELEGDSYTMLPPGATQAWDQESRQLGTWLWPILGVPVANSPLVFDLYRQPLDSTPVTSIICSNTICSSYIVGFNSSLRQADHDNIVDLNRLINLPTSRSTGS